MEHESDGDILSVANSGGNFLGPCLEGLMLAVRPSYTKTSGIEGLPALIHSGSFDCTKGLLDRCSLSLYSRPGGSGTVLARVPII